MSASALPSAPTCCPLGKSPRTLPHPKRVPGERGSCSGWGYGVRSSHFPVGPASPRSRRRGDAQPPAEPRGPSPPFPALSPFCLRLRLRFLLLIPLSPRFKQLGPTWACVPASRCAACPFQMWTCPASTLLAAGPSSSPCKQRCGEGLALPPQPGITPPAAPRLRVAAAGSHGWAAPRESPRGGRTRGGEAAPAHWGPDAGWGDQVLPPALLCSRPLAELLSTPGLPTAAAGTGAGPGPRRGSDFLGLFQPPGSPAHHL